MPLFLSTPDDQDWQPIDQDARSNTWPQHRRSQPAACGTRPGSEIPVSKMLAARCPADVHSAAGPLDYQDARYQDARYQDTRYQDDWLHDVTESDRERQQAFGAPTLLTSPQDGILAATVVAALVALFALEDPRSLISNASASLAGRASGLPQQHRSSGAGKGADRGQSNPCRLQRVAVAPTREAISVAYQTALQSQPEVRQPPAPPPAPPAAPAARRLDPDELAALLKRAKGLIDVGDIRRRAIAARTRRRCAGGRAPRSCWRRPTIPPCSARRISRSITPDPAAARIWYQKAAQFGSQEAQQRLAQMQN